MLLAAYVPARGRPHAAPRGRPLSGAYPRLFSPITLNRVTLKNRIVSTAHATGYAVDGYPRERYRDHYERKARAAWGW